MAMRWLSATIKLQISNFRATQINCNMSPFPKMGEHICYVNLCIYSTMSLKIHQKANNSTTSSSSAAPFPVVPMARTISDPSKVATRTLVVWRVSWWYDRRPAESTQDTGVWRKRDREIENVKSAACVLCLGKKEKPVKPADSKLKQTMDRPETQLSG